MKQTITQERFIEKFRKKRPEKFSLAGLYTLYDMLTQLEEVTGVEIELDVIAICREYAEYEDLEEAFEDWDISQDDSISAVTSSGTIIVNTR